MIPRMAHLLGRYLGLAPISRAYAIIWPQYGTIAMPHDKVMSMPTQRPSISAFFPAYNDGGTIGSLVVRTLHTWPS